MDLPIELTDALRRRAEGYKLADLQAAAQRISKAYNGGNLQGARVVTSDVDALVYALSRMPATYGAIKTALKYVGQLADYHAITALDIGAGTGAAAFACECGKVICIEREPAMRRLGESLAEECGVECEWIDGDLIRYGLPRAQLVTSCYCLNELAQSELDGVLKRIWSVTDGILLIVEPGTPAGYAVIRRAGDILGKAGANIVAPCPDIAECPLENGDWCHFTCRIGRSKIHKALKGGEAPYEDEKFSYIAFSVFPTQKVQARILRHPYVEKGMITLQLCTRFGAQCKKVGKGAGVSYKIARKSSCGDGMDIE